MHLGHGTNNVDHGANGGASSNNLSSRTTNGSYRSASTPPTSAVSPLSSMKQQQQIGDEIRRLQTPPPPGFNAGGGSTTAAAAATANGLSGTRGGGQGRQQQQQRAESPSLHDSPILASGLENYDGAALRLMGSVSAPPPPGFVETSSGRASSSLWGHQESGSGGGGSSIFGSGGGRTSSFTNLANLLGTGLAESMDDSTRPEQLQSGGLFPNTGVTTTFESLLDESSVPAPAPTHSNSQRHHIHHHQRTGPSTANAGTTTSASGSSNNSNGNGVSSSSSFGGSDLSFARQSRHAASRLIRSGGGSGGYAGGPMHLDASSTLLPPMSSVQHQQQQQQQQRRQLKDGEDFSSLKERQGGEGGHHQHQHDESSSLGIFAESSSNSNNRNKFQIPTRNDHPGMKVIMEPLDLGRKSAPPQFEFALSGGNSNDLLNNRHQMEQQQQQQQRSNVRIVVPKHAVTTTATKPGMSNAQPTTTTSTGNRSSNQLQDELRPFVWDVHSATEPSRSLVIWNAYALHVSDIKMTCEAFGVLEAFRSDFADRGVIFVGYYDIRSAQYAAVELKACLQRFSPPANDSGHSSDLIDVEYCVPLNSSSANDESLIVLSHMPPDVDEETLSNIIASYGSVRSLARNGAGGGRYGNISSSSSSFSSYIVEFHNIQDAKQALLELESTQPWGADVMVDVGTRNPVDRKKGRELLALMGRWRQQGGGGGNVASPSATNTGRGRDAAGRNPYQDNRQNNNRNVNQHGTDQHSTQHTQQQQQQTTTQLVLGPDGQYSYVVVHPNQHHVDNVGHYHSAAGADSHAIRVLQQQGQASAPAQHYVHGPHGTYVASVQQNSSPHMAAPSQQHYWQHAAATQQAAMPPHQYHQISVNSHQYVDGHSYAANAGNPYYAHVPVSAPKLGGNPDSSVSSGSASGGPLAGLGVQMDAMTIRTVSGGGGGGGGAGNDEKDNTHLTLDIKSVDSGRDTRTSLMVRNIPNKYTQQMLLSELTENGHGPGKIDFFYLPIDFKNRCNRGYAFVNFVDYRDIVPFHRQYYGQHWKVFNSDKICDITYARIQGKTGMLKRFENSVLMEKDDEYKPLVFVSHGNEKGKRVQFPASSPSPAPA
mmetsp:Transcript_23827/g.33438  ORF Transcript_23827/g.33438 Transcript_23827/m.33438 type:complete len:1104 (-) Transcript_23827:57-3368(-)